MSKRWIATRVFTDVDGYTACTAQLGEPRRAESGIWECSVHIFGDDFDVRTTAHGIDPLQALTNGIECVRRETQGHNLSWVGGAGSGLSAPIPLTFGLTFHDRFVDTIENAIGSRTEEMMLEARAKGAAS